MDDLLLKTLPTLGTSVPMIALLFLVVKYLAYQLLKQTECHIADLKEIQKNTILIVAANTEVITKLSLLIDELLHTRNPKN